MNVHDLFAWSGPALDALVLLGLGATWWQLRRDPTVAWREYEARLRELQESLRLLVMQAEGEARDLDRRLAAHAEQIGSAGAEAAVERAGARSGRAERAGKATPRATDEERRATPRATDEERRATPRARADEPRITPLAAAMAATASVPAPPPLQGTEQPPASLADRVQQPRASLAERVQQPRASLAERVQQLAAAHTPISEIARKLSLPIAEARVLAGLTTGGLGFAAAPSPARETAGGARIAS